MQTTGGCQHLSLTHVETRRLLTLAALRYARICSALGIVRDDGTPGDVDAVLTYLATLQQRAARVHELEAQLAYAWDEGRDSGLCDGPHGTNPHR
jgi:hypothetical protein